MKIDLLEIGIGNIGSIKRCLKNLDVDFRTVNAFNQPDGSRPLVLPGVGQFGAVMRALKQNDLNICLQNLISKGTQYLGICSGMQVLFDSSEEAKDIGGLGIIKGKIVRFQNGKVPQIGWNIVRSKNADNDEGTERQYAYFVNSYYARPELTKIISHTSNYFGEFCAAIKSDNITAAQFHPEKSAEFGMKFLRGWLDNVS